jgi:phytol kinase
MNNWIAAIITLVLCVVWLRVMDFAAHRGWIESRLSRKVIHITNGPIFVLCWLMFDNAPEARWLAAAVPLLITLQFALIGFGVIKDEASVQAMSRSGDRHEILRGPLYYGIVFVVLTILFWKDSPIGMTALMLMCGGDGIADVVGRRIASPKLPWSRDKSLAGSISVFLGGLLMALLVLSVYVSLGLFPAPLSGYLVPLLILSFAATLVESLPFRDVDNLTLTLVVTLLGLILF